MYIYIATGIFTWQSDRPVVNGGAEKHDAEAGELQVGATLPWLACKTNQ